MNVLYESLQYQNDNVKQLAYIKITISQKSIGFNKVRLNLDVLNLYVPNGTCMKKYCLKTCTYQRGTFI